jgi:hypothetical protein
MSADIDGPAGLSRLSLRHEKLSEVPTKDNCAASGMTLENNIVARSFGRGAEA